MVKYDASSIKILKGLEAVRKRPGMYIGSTDSSGLHHLVWELVDNAVDEVLGGFASFIKVKLNRDGSLTIIDNGRGIPVDTHAESRKSAIELIFTELHAGGKFGSETSAYKISGGLNGVGASVVNALSAKLIATVFKNGQIYETIFENGGAVKQSTKIVGNTNKKGTKVQFWPDKAIFGSLTFSLDLIRERLRESSFLVQGVEISLTSTVGEFEIFKAKNGIGEFVSFINESKTPLTNVASFKGCFGEINAEVGFQYTDDYSETIISFVNNIKTQNGGTHESALRSSWTKVVNEYARSQNLLKAKDSNLEGSDIREGITAIVSVKVPEKLIAFVGQTKDSLRTIEAKVAVEKLVQNELFAWLQKNKQSAHKIINKAISASRARLAARKARKDMRETKKRLRDSRSLSGKLTPAQSKKVSEKELFLVEGDSAGGSAKLGRNRRYQAILPLRGKVVNTEKSKLIDILKNEEISAMINTIGGGVGSEFSLADAQYGKIIIMTDADTDGAHIQTLLLTFLFRYMRPLIESGRVFIAMPPLYKVSKRLNNKEVFEYAWDEVQLKNTLETIKNGQIQRYKGLGEMNSDQLWDTTMNPESRTLIKVNIDDAAFVERRVSTLMGEKAAQRKEWIERNVHFSLEDSFLAKQT